MSATLKHPSVEAMRAPPQAVDSERSVLGALLLWPDAYDRIEFLRVEHFYTAAHRTIFEAAQALLEAGKATDATTLGAELARRGSLEEVGGKAYLGALAANTPSAANIRRYAETVVDRWRLRQAIAKAMEVCEAAYGPLADPVAIAEAAESSFLDILDNNRGSEMVTFARAVADAIDAREAPAEVVIRTGYQRLDGMLKGGGLKPGQLAIVAGRSSMGKSAFAWNVAEHAAAHVVVAGFTLEMTREELAERSLCYHEQMMGENVALDHLRMLTMHLDETPSVSVSHIRLRCRRLKRKHGLGLIVVDYLQLMTGRGENRTQEIGSISRGLKALAKELQVPVIAVAQINRGVEQRQDKRPMLSDLRESGDIENDADIVLMLYRDEYYNPATEARGLAEVLIRKQRNGPVGMVPLRFDGPTTRFTHYEGDVPRNGAEVKNSTGSIFSMGGRVKGHQPKENT